MTPTSIAIRLKPIMKRKIRTPELNVYAERLNLKRSNGKQGGNVCYVWEEKDFNELLKIIE